MVIVSPHCGIAPTSGSGGERYEVDLLSGLLSAGDDPHILLAHGKPAPPELEKHVERIRPERGLRWPVMLGVMPYWIGRCVRAHWPDLIRAHSLRFTGLPALIAARRYGLPMVAHLHHLDPGPMNVLIERTVMRGADLVIADSESSKRQAVALGVPAERIRVVYCGVPSVYAPGRCLKAVWDRYGLGEPGAFVILSVGPMIPRKDPLGTIRVFARVLHQDQNRPRPTLLWIGDGPLRHDAQRLAESLGIADAVRLPGYVPEEDKLWLYRAARAYLTLSRLEGFPLGALEAMACGVPVVAHRVPPFTELVEEEVSGLLVPNDFASRLVQLIGSVGWQKLLSHGAAARVDRYFRLRHMVQGVREVYEEAVG